MAGGIVGEDDVVMAGAFYFVKPEVRPSEVGAIGTHGETGELVLRFAIDDFRPAAIVQTNFMSVAQDGGIVAVAAFPRLIEAKDLLALDGGMEFQPGAVELVDEQPIDEEFAA